MPVTIGPGFVIGPGFAVGSIPPFSATGGTVTTDGAYTIHTFTASGTFQVISGSNTVEVIAWGGGGGGGGGSSFGNTFTGETRPGGAGSGGTAGALNSAGGTGGAGAVIVRYLT